MMSNNNSITSCTLTVGCFLTFVLEPPRHQKRQHPAFNQSASESHNLMSPKWSFCDQSLTATVFNLHSVSKQICCVRFKCTHPQYRLVAMFSCSVISNCVWQGRCAEDLYKGIQSSDSGVRCDSLKLLANVSTDITFAQEFISRNGHSLLVKIVEDAHESVSCLPVFATFLCFGLFYYSINLRFCIMFLVQGSSDSYTHSYCLHGAHGSWHCVLGESVQCLYKKGTKATDIIQLHYTVWTL